MMMMMRWRRMRMKCTTHPETTTMRARMTQSSGIQRTSSEEPTRKAIHKCRVK